MDLEKDRLEVGDLIKIKNVIYEVVFIQGGAEPSFTSFASLPSPRIFLGIFLKELNKENHTKSTKEPSHILKFYYEDTKECKLLPLRSEEILASEMEIIKEN